MRLYVYVLEARGLPPAKDSGVYAKLHMGRHKSRTKTVKRSMDPVWNEEFVFRVEDEEEELEVGVFCEDDGIFNGGGELLGRVRVAMWTVLDEGRQTLPPTWFSLQPDPNAGGKFDPNDCGKILLTISLCGRSNGSFASLGEMVEQDGAPMDILTGTGPSTTASCDKSMSVSEGTNSVQALAGRLVQKLLHKNGETLKAVSRNHDSLQFSDSTASCDSNTDGTSSSCPFEEAIEIMQSRDETEMPENLQGGILLEQMYMIEPRDLNSFLFEPNSQFRRDLAELQGTTDYEEGQWTWKCKDMTCLRRMVTYTIAATKLIKAVKAMEEQAYLKADGRGFAVLTSVCTPNVPYGNCFQVDLLCKIIPGPELSSGEESSHLVISWNINFYQSTLMKGMIEGSARQGLKESYEQFVNLLAQSIKPVNPPDLELDKEHILGPLQLEHQSDWEMAIEYLCNFTVASTLFMGLYVLLHIFLSEPCTIQGLEFNGIDLPDTFGELITCGILILQGERAFNKISHFVQARFQRGSDHGVKAQGDGWLLTVALIEGSNLPSAASTGYSDPYVVFSCNGKTRTSSVQLQTFDPQWNEILEFDAMQEPPSVLDVEVFDFDGPFDMAVSLGHAEINFLKHTSAELADMWVLLEGKLAQPSQSKLHLRIFLDNSKGVETVREYLSKMEKEVGKKLHLRSPHRNLTFQKLFGLPPEEFLINDFSCYLKRKMPLQGRIFLSARIVGFHANIFGHKTNFFFLWEDIEDIQVIPPSFATFGSPALIIILRKDRGLDAKHGAKSQDEEGRLRFQFQSFVSFNIASRTIMALWRTKTMTSERKAQMEEDEQDQGGKSVQFEDTESFLNFENTCLSKTYSTELPFQINSLMKIFDGGHLEKKIMEKVGCLNYMVTSWEAVKPNIYERHIRYKFNRHVSIFGGEVTSTQQRAPIVDGNGWIVDEVMTLNNVPFGDHFHVCLRYQIESPPSSVALACQCHVFVGIVWTKSTIFQKRISRNICEKLTHRLKEIFELAEVEILSGETLENVT